MRQINEQILAEIDVNDISSLENYADRIISSITDEEDFYDIKTILQAKIQSLKDLSRLEQAEPISKIDEKNKIKQFATKETKLHKSSKDEIINQSSIHLNLKEKLKDFYQSKGYIERLFYPHDPLLVTSIYVNLQIIEEREQKKKEFREEHYYYDREESLRWYEINHNTESRIKPENIFSFSKQEIKKIFIEGRAGVGKSTLCKYLTFYWSSNNALLNLWQDKFDFVFNIPLRELNSDDNDIAEVLKRVCFQGDLEGTEMLKQIINNKNVLWLLDGYDELTIEKGKPIEKLFHDLIGKSYVILTSRPGYHKPDNNTWGILEITGFNISEIEKYVFHFYNALNEDESDKQKKQYKAEMLLRLLDSNPSIRGTAHIPINLELICSLYDKKTIPDEEVTLTFLYEEILKTLYERCHMKHLEVIGKDTEEIKTEITHITDIVNDTYKQHTEFLSLFAFIGMKKNKIILEKSALDETFEEFIKKYTEYSNTDKRKLFMKEVLKLHLIKETSNSKYNSYYFIHLTFQEIFAAKYLFNLTKNIDHKTVKIIDNKLFEDSIINIRYLMVWSFFIGLLKNNGYSSVNFFEYMTSNSLCYTTSYGLALLLMSYEESNLPITSCKKIVNQIISLCQNYLENDLMSFSSDFLRFIGYSRRLSLHGDFQAYLIELFTKEEYRIDHRIYNFLENINYISDDFQKKLFNYLSDIENTPPGDYEPDPDDKLFKWDVCIKLLSNCRNKGDFFYRSIEQLLLREYSSYKAAVLVILHDVYIDYNWLSSYILKCKIENLKDFYSFRHKLNQKVTKRVDDYIENNLRTKINEIMSSYMMPYIGSRDDTVAFIKITLPLDYKFLQTSFKWMNDNQNAFQWRKFIVLYRLLNTDQTEFDRFKIEIKDLGVFIVDIENILINLIYANDSIPLAELAFKLLLKFQSVRIASKELFHAFQNKILSISDLNQLSKDHCVNLINFLCEKSLDEDSWLLLKRSIEKVDDLSECIINLALLIVTLLKSNTKVNRRMYNKIFFILSKLSNKDLSIVLRIIRNEDVINQIYKSDLIYFEILDKINYQEVITDQEVLHLEKLTGEVQNKIFYIDRLCLAFAAYKKLLPLKMITLLFSFFDIQENYQNNYAPIFYSREEYPIDSYHCLKSLINSNVNSNAVVDILSRKIPATMEESLKRPLYHKLILDELDKFENKPSWLIADLNTRAYPFFGYIDSKILRGVREKNPADICCFLDYIYKEQKDSIEDVLDYLSKSDIDKKILFKCIFDRTSYSYDDYDSQQESPSLLQLEKILKEFTSLIMPKLIVLIEEDKGLAVRLLKDFALDDYISEVLSSVNKLRIEPFYCRLIFSSTSPVKLLDHAIMYLDITALKCFYITISETFCFLFFIKNKLYFSTKNSVKIYENEKLPKFFADSFNRFFISDKIDEEEKLKEPISITTIINNLDSSEELTKIDGSLLTTIESVQQTLQNTENTFTGTLGEGLDLQSNTFSPQKTAGFGDCAFHAIFGKWNGHEFVCDDVVHKRKEMANSIRACKTDPILYNLVKEAVKAIIMENKSIDSSNIKEAQTRYKLYAGSDQTRMQSAWIKFYLILESYPAVMEFINSFCKNYCEKKNIALQNLTFKDKFQTCLNESDDALRGMILSIQKLDKALFQYNVECSAGFNWEQIYNSSELTNEYVNFIEKQGNWLIPVELQIISYVFNTTLDYYIKNPAIPYAAPVKSDTYSPGKPDSTCICFNGINHYERMASQDHLVITQKRVDRKTLNPNSDLSSTQYTPSHKILNDSSSSFWQSAQIDNREPLYSLDKVKIWLKEILSDEIRLGTAIGKGDCFFDAIAQGLNQREGKDEYNVQSLRILCDEYVKDSKNKWVEQANKKDRQDHQSYLVRIQFTANELETQEKQGLKLGTAVWGRPKIEGKIFCEKFAIKLHVIEIQEDGSVNRLIVDDKGEGEELNPTINYSDENIIHIVNYHNHYVPLVQTRAIKREQHSSFKPLYEIPQDSSKLKEQSSVISAIPSVPLKTLDVSKNPILAPSHQNLSTEYTDETTEHLEDIKLRARWPEETVNEGTFKLIKILYHKAKEYYQQQNIAQLLHFYVEPDATDLLGSETREFLDKEIRDFLSQTRKEQKILLLMGDSGAGKSLFTARLEHQQWQESTQTSNYIPLRIELKAFIGESVKQCIKQTLIQSLNQISDQHDLNINVIDQLKKLPFLFILDGYDEIAQNLNNNLYTENHLAEWPLAKVIITCRTQYFASQMQSHSIFMSYWNSNPDLKSLKQLYLAPFNNNQIENYLAKYLTEHPEHAKVRDYLEHIKELLSNPFILKIFCEALPLLLEKLESQKSNENSFSKPSLTRLDIYQAFMRYWFAKQKERIAQSFVHKNIVCPMDIDESFVDYAKLLAFTMFCHKKIEVEYKEIRSKFVKLTIDHQVWEQFFTSNDEEAVLARNACPLKRIGDYCYSFIHKSFLEYFVTEFLWVEIQEITKKRQLLTKESYLNQRLLSEEPAIIEFMVDYLSNLPEEKVGIMKQQLINIVKASKGRENKVLGTASANAITILNYAKVSLSGEDFNDVCIQGADLRRAILHRTNFTNADLTEVKLNQAYMAQANLSHSQMKGLQFGELPSLNFNERVNCLSFSPDVKALAVGQDKIIVIREVASDNQLLVLKGHSGSVNNIAFSADGTMIVSGSDDHSVRIWDTRSGEVLKILKGHSRDVTSIALSADGTIVASASWDKSVRLWETKSGKELQVLGGNNWKVTTVAMSADATIVVAAGSFKNIIQLWEVKSRNVLQVLRGHTSYVVSVALNKDGSIVASGSWDNSVRLWDTKSGKVLQVLEGHSHPVTSVALGADGTILASGSLDNSVRLWEVKSGKILQILYGHTGGVQSVVFSSDGTIIASGSLDKSVRLWLVNSGEALKSLQRYSGKITNVAMNANGTIVTSGCADKTQLCEVKSGKVLQVLEGHIGSVTNVAINAAGTIIASGGTDKTVRLWEAKSGNELQALQGHGEVISSVALSLDGTLVVSGSYDGSVRLWDAKSGKALLVLQAHSGNIHSVGLSTNSTIVASGSSDGSVHLWEVKGGKVLWVAQKHNGGVTCVAFSTDGTTLASGSRDCSVRLWEAKNGKILNVLQGHSDVVHNVTISTDNSTLASASADETIRLWDMATHQCIAIIANGAPVLGVSYIRYGQLISCDGAPNNSVRFWQLMNNQWHLKWSSPQQALCMAGCVIEGVKDLSDQNRRLIEQRSSEIKLLSTDMSKTLPVVLDDKQETDLKAADSKGLMMKDPLLIPIKEKPLSENDKKDKLVEYLFNGILKELKSLKLNKSNPRLFLVYAHEGKDKSKTADAKIARTLINWLHKDLEINLYSDRSKRGNGTDKYDERAEANILWSQLCLLPNDQHAIDYVILCGSQLIGSYAASDVYEKFYSELFAAFDGLPTSEKWHTYQHRYNALSGIVDKWTRQKEFHQAMTELVFLQIRRIKAPQAQVQIIPLLLNGEASQSLPEFIKGHDVRIEESRWREHGNWDEQETYKSQGLHVAFFKLLERLYAKEDKILDIIIKYKKTYDETIELIQNGHFSEEEINAILEEARKENAKQLAAKKQLAFGLFGKGLRINEAQNLSDTATKENKDKIQTDLAIPGNNTNPNTNNKSLGL